MKTVYNYYKSTLEDYNVFKGISCDVESLLDKSEFDDKVKELQHIRHTTVATALEEYLSTVHSVNISNLRKQIQNCNNFKIKDPFDKFKSFSYRQGDSRYTEYYFGDERILTAYSDGYVYYGGWKSMYREFTC